MRAHAMRSILFCLLPALLLAPALVGQTAPDSLTPVCAPVPGGGSTTSAPPTLLVTLFDRWHEAWLGSPAVADLTGDGSREILAARDQKLLGWSAAGAIVFDETAPAGRIWSSPVVGELVPRRAPGSRSRRPRARRSTCGAPPGIRSRRFRSPGATSCVRSPPARSTATRRSSSWWRRLRGSKPTASATC